MIRLQPVVSTAFSKVALTPILSPRIGRGEDESASLSLPFYSGTSWKERRRLEYGHSPKLGCSGVACCARKVRAVFCLLALSLASAGSGARAQQTPSSAADTRTFTPTPHFEKGQMRRYRTLSSMTLAFTAPDGKDAGIGQSMGLEITLRYRAQEVRPDGTVTLAVVSEGGKLVNPPEEPVTLPPEKETDKAPRTALLDKQGRILGLKSPASKSNAGPLGGLIEQPANLFLQLHLLSFPDRPIKVGDTWTARSPLPNAKTGQRAESGAGEKESDSADDPNFIHTRMTLLGTEMVDGQETLKIRQEITVPFEAQADAEGRATTDSAKAASHVTARILFTQTVNALPTDGQVVRTQGEIGGWIKLEGAVVKQAPSDTLKIGGQIAAARVPEPTGAAK